MKDIAADVVKSTVRGSTARRIARSPACPWFLYASGLLFMFFVGMHLGSEDTKTFAGALGAAVFLIGFSMLLLPKFKPKTRCIMLILPLIPMLAGHFINLYSLMSHYQLGLTYLQQGNYEKAQSFFLHVNGFRDSEEKAAECQYWIDYMQRNGNGHPFSNTDYEPDYNRALGYMEAGQYELAQVWFDWLGDYKDSRQKAEDCTNYAAYTSILQACGNDIMAAYPKMQRLRGFPPADELLATPEYQAARKELLQVGKKVMFGRWHEDSVILWTIIARNGDKALLLCDGARDLTSSTNSANVTWADSSVRQWLNVTFLQRSFSAQEQTVILPTALDNDGDGILDTTDLIFLLSAAETQQYLPTSEARRKASLGYSVFSDVWLLRMTGAPSSAVQVCTNDGELTTVTYEETLIIRPAMWVTLDPDFF